MMPTISIVTPSFNQGEFIEETIRSVLSQDYPCIEYIVIDGGSTDNTLEILGKYKDRLTWISEPDKGQADAINKGFRKAKGEILCWLNSDDLYEAGAVRRAVEYLFDNPDTMMVYGAGNEIDGNGNFLRRFPTLKEFDLSKLIHVCDYILQPATFFRKTVFDEIDMLDTELRWCMDWDLWIRIGGHFRVSYIDYVVANSRVYADTKTRSGGMDRLKEIVSVMRKYGSKKYPLGFFIYGEDSLETVAKQRFPIVFLFLRVLFLPVRVALICITKVFAGIDL